MSTWIERWQIDGRESRIFTLLDEKPSKKFLWFEERLAKIQATTAWNLVRSVKSSSEDGKTMGDRKTKAGQRSKLRGIHFIDPEDGEYKETI